MLSMSCYRAYEEKLPSMSDVQVDSQRNLQKHKYCQHLPQLQWQGRSLSKGLSETCSLWTLWFPWIRYNTQTPRERNLSHKTTFLRPEKKDGRLFGRQRHG